MQTGKLHCAVMLLVLDRFVALLISRWQCVFKFDAILKALWNGKCYKMQFQKYKKKKKKKFIHVHVRLSHRHTSKNE